MFGKVCAILRLVPLELHRQLYAQTYTGISREG
jgi:hypothetical protein